MEYLTFHAEDADAGKRLDAFLAEKIEGWSRVRLQKVVADGDVSVNETPAKSSYKVRAADQIEIELPAPVVEAFEPENIALDIVFEDEFLAVINKPAGMVVHPGAGVRSGTLANAVAFHFNLQTVDSKFENRVGIVHRLDKDTSGLIVIAKNEEIHEQLSEQFRQREVFKSYVALVHGEVAGKSGTIDQPIAREKHNRTKMAIRSHGRAAVSLWQIRKRYERFTSLNVEIKTGRTHQIRVHLSHIGHPVVGDETYNGGRDNNIKDDTIREGIKDLGRFFLHAERLSFTHPTSGERLEFYAALPPELMNFLGLIKKSAEFELEQPL